MKKFLFLFIVLSAFCFAACAPSANTYEKANPSAKKTLVNDRRIVTDSGTNEIASPIELRSSKTNDGFIKLQLEVMNVSRGLGNLLYLVEWYDNAGMLIQTNPTWQTKVIPAGKLESIQVIAPVPNAVDFRITLMRKN